MQGRILSSMLLGRSIEDEPIAVSRHRYIRVPPDVAMQGLELSL